MHLQFVSNVIVLRANAHLEVLPIERQGPADQCVQDDPETPNVHLRTVVLLPLEELRSSVRRRSTESVQLAAHSELVAEAKVGDLDVHVSI